MPLVISLKTESSIPLEVDGILPETVRGQSLDEIKATPIQRGNRQVSLAEFFDVSGSAAEDEEVVWEGDCSRVKLIGTKMSSGRIRVDGNAGMHLGAEMSGGEIVVNGDTGDWLGAEMHGGRIHVHGKAGHLVGAVYRGGRRGMTGGEILVEGDAGNEIGHTMRRGTIAIGGRTGDATGFGMLAGSILLFGESGIRSGAGMRRGTIGFLGTEEPPEMLPTFKPAGRLRPVFMNIYLRHLRTRGFRVDEKLLDAEYDRFSGDFLEGGRGEILIRSRN